MGPQNLRVGPRWIHSSGAGAVLAMNRSSGEEALARYAARVMGDAVTSQKPLSLLLAGLLLLACEDKSNPPVDPPRSSSATRPELTVLDGAAGASDAAAAAAAVIAELRRDKLSLAPRSRATGSIVFGRGRVIQLATEALTIRDAKEGKEVLKLEVAGGRLVTLLRDGSVLALLEKETLSIEPRKNEVSRYSRVALFPESRVFADPLVDRRFYVVHAFDPTLYGYEITEDQKISTLDFVDMPEFDGRVFTSLKDGSFLYSTATGLQRFFLKGKAQAYAIEDPKQVWRVATARRLDRVWLARDDGSLELRELTAKTPRLIQRIDVKDPIDVASSDAGIAVLRLAPAEGGRHFQVEFFDESTERRFTSHLALDEASGSGEGWVRDVLRNRGIMLTDDGALLAVGGPSELHVWNVRSGKKRY